MTPRVRPRTEGPSRLPALLAVVVLCGGLLASVGRHAPGDADPCADTLSCNERSGGEAAAAATGPPPLPHDACANAAYLCDGLVERGTPRILRWDGATREIRVLVPLPPDEDPAVGRRLQQAAARGIRAWDGHPFPLRVTLRPRDGLDPDVTVRWAHRLGDRRLGVTSTQWGPRAGGLTIRVDDFGLATRSPFDDDRVLEPRQVELTAAHEMGHTLGLPHSDQPRDVMYPTNTASALSARDYRAMERLYALPNGARLDEGEAGAP